MMNKNSVAKIAILLVVLAANTANAAYDVAKYCQLVSPGTKFPSFDSCQKYFICYSNGGYGEQICPPEESFDRETQSCRAASMVNCYYGVQDPCSYTVGEAFVANPKNCHGYFYCLNSKEVAAVDCPSGQVFNGKACDYSACNTGDGSGTGIVKIGDMCNIMKSGVYFGDFDDCTAWHKCINGRMTNGKCTQPLVYNTFKGMCLNNDGTMCSRVQNPSVTPSLPCNATAANSYKGDANVCSVYYKCDGTVWKKLTCPDQQYFDVKINRCLARQAATPSVGCNRCQYATTEWVNAVDSKCEDYLTCKGGNIIGNGTCGSDNYFNEIRQRCMDGYGDLTPYRQTNGACYKAAENPPAAGGESNPPAGGENPPAAGGENPPAAGGENPPAAGGESNPPAGGESNPPAGGENHPPAGGESNPPAGGESNPPAGGENTPPAGGESNPPAGGESNPPAGGGNLTPAGGSASAAGSDASKS